jgi:hypothetical protein
MKPRVPAEVWPLASFLYDEMKARGWNTDDCASRMGAETPDELGVDMLTLSLIMCVHKDNCLVGDAMFHKLSLAFDMSEQFFRNLDETWRNAPADRRSPWECPEDIFGPVTKSGLPTHH